jgi:NADH-quinone oxidoreductase subunit N
MAILPELMLLTGAAAFFVLSLYKQLDFNQVKNAVVCFGIVTFIAALISLKSQATMFYGSYEVDLYSQVFKLMISFGVAIVLIFGKDLKDIE